ncbi:MAG TPA: hypothetical protein VMW71_01115 [Thermoplasmata archaeon]|nr:hypothetical protein [Thermoplasmata archaeon]
MLAEHDCAKALEAIELMIDLGSCVNGEYDLMSAGEGLRSGEIGEKQA